ncbi:MAG: response regulator transcription factor, partial [Chloroflexota bacterium]
MTTQQTVLVVDDEQFIREIIVDNLEIRGYQTLEAGTGLEALALLKSDSPDLVLLDVMMPHMDGYETCRRIRQASNVPIMMLTALEEEQDKVQALDLGADDYITKPFGIDELLARIRALLRRATVLSPASIQTTSKALSYQGLELNPNNNSVFLSGSPIKLTRTEFSLLHYLMQKPGQLIPHDELLTAIWGKDHNHQPEYLRVYVRRLRHKIEE